MIKNYQDPQADIKSLEQLYSFRKPIEISRYLEGYPFLVPLLFEAHDQIKKYFKSENHSSHLPIFLEVLTDPEIGGERQLILSIATELAADEAFTTLAQLGKDWWLDTLEQAQLNLCITVEFQ